MAPLIRSTISDDLTLQTDNFTLSWVHHSLLSNCSFLLTETEPQPIIFRPGNLIKVDPKGSSSGLVFRLGLKSPDPYAPAWRPGTCSHQNVPKTQNWKYSILSWIYKSQSIDNSVLITDFPCKISSKFGPKKYTHMAYIRWQAKRDRTKRDKKGIKHQNLPKIS